MSYHLGISLQLHPTEVVMKTLIWIVTGIVAGAVALPAQQGRGGPPLAWNDKDKDGICDITGQPVGQMIGPGPAGAQMMGRGRGGAPFAWNDKDKDGICDITGQPIPQGFAAGAAGAAVPPGAWARGRGPCGRGRGAWARGRGAWGRGGGAWGWAGRGGGWWPFWQQQQPPQPQRQQQSAPATPQSKPQATEQAK